MARSYTPSNFYIEERFQDPSLPGTHGIVRRRASTPSPRETPTLSAGETPRTRRLCGASPRVELATNGKKQTGRFRHRPRPPSRAAVPERRPAGCPAHTPVIGRRNRLPGRGWVASSSSASRAAQRRASSPTERSMSAVTADTAGLIAACFAPSVVRTRRPKTAPNPPSGGEIRVVGIGIRVRHRGHRGDGIHLAHEVNSACQVATRRPCHVGPSRTNVHSGFLATSRRLAQTRWKVGTSASAHSKYVTKS